MTSARVNKRLHLWKGPKVKLLFDNPLSIDLEGRSHEEFFEWIDLPELKFGFASIVNYDVLNELEMEVGDRIPFTITDNLCDMSYFPGFREVYWAGPDDEAES